MGIDVTMYVALENESDVEILNKRFRETHEPDYVLISDTEFLINQKKESKDRLDSPPKFENIFMVGDGSYRYYGIGYERGPVMRIITQIEWLRGQKEVLAVFYGGNNCDFPPLFTEEDSRKLLWHFFKVGETPYRGSRIEQWKDGKIDSREQV